MTAPRSVRASLSARLTKGANWNVNLDRPDSDDGVSRSRAASGPSVEPVTRERLDQLAFLVGEVREERVGEEVDRALDGVHAVLLAGDQADERAVDALEQVGDRLVL